MAYSDYGSYNWKRESNTWVLKPEYEDTTLIGNKMPNELEQLTGLKLDVAQFQRDQEENYPDLTYEIKGVHHSVIGDLNGFAVVSYKGSPTVLHKGLVIDELTYEDVWDTEWVNGEEVPKENFTPKTIHAIDEDKNQVKVAIDTKTNYWSVAYVKNGESEYLSICGYGLGDHWWLDEFGNNITEDNEGEQPTWPREEECLQIALDKIAEITSEPNLIKG